MALSLAAPLACASDPEVACGEGTVEQDGVCVAGSTGAQPGGSTGPSSSTQDEAPANTTGGGVGESSDAGTHDPAADSSSGDAPEPPLVLFTTSEEFTADLHGIEGADTVCQDAATAAGLPGTFLAWLSTYEIDAIDRVGEGPWNLVDGTRAFDDPGGLLDEPLASLSLDEYGSALSTDDIHLVWTGTDIDGRRAVTPNCIGGDEQIEWNADEPGPYGAAFGLPDVPEEWTSSMGALQCNELAHLYCFEVRATSNR